MNLFKKAAYAIVLVVIYTCSFLCAGQKVNTSITFEELAPFKVKSVSFQKKYTDNKTGARDIMIYFNIANLSKAIKIERVYFRNLSEKLNEKDGKYEALLKKESQDQTINNSEKRTVYPFKILDSECVVSYIEGETIKYIKVSAYSEIAATYYESGPPSIYVRQNASGIASLDEEEDDD